MDESTKSFWSKKPDELTVSDQMKTIALMPIVLIGATVVPIIVFGKIAEIRQARKLKKHPELAIVTTDEEA